MGPPIRDGGWQLRWRDPRNSPPPAIRLDTPYEPEARYATKRTTSWVGYKVHLTETCDAEDPHLITHVETTPSTTSDISRVTPIHQALQAKDLLPRQHLVDSAYVSAEELVAIQTTYNVDLLGPIQGNGWWQAKAGHRRARSRTRSHGSMPKSAPRP